MEGEIIAFRTVLKRVPRSPGTEGEKYDEVRETLPESYFIKGYTKPVTMGEGTRLKVQIGPAVTIDGSEYKQYTVVE